MANAHTFFVGEDGVLVHNSRTRRNLPPDLPLRDGTRKAHGKLPRPKDLLKHPCDELENLKRDLELSVQERIRKNIELGSDEGHGQRQNAEQDLIKSIEEVLSN